LFNFTRLVEDCVADMTATLPELSHLRPNEIAVAAAGRWAGRRWGNLAACVGLAEAPEPTFAIWVKPRTRRVVEVSRWYRRRSPAVEFRGHTARYLILLRLPRMLEHDPLETLLHELFHVGENFDGRLRPLRHGRLFDAQVGGLRRRWLRGGEPRLRELIGLGVPALYDRFGGIVARRLPVHFQAEWIEEVEPPGPYEEHLQRLYPGYRLDPKCRLRPAPASRRAPADRLTDRDCPWRYFHAAGSRDLSPALARYF